MLASRTRAVGLLLLALSFTSCGGTPPVPDTKSNDLSSVFEIYSIAAKNHQKPPQQLSELANKDHEKLHPNAVRALKNGEVIVVWGTPVGGTEILAYEKDAPQNGGMVVLANGIVKNMSAAAVQAVVKSKG